MPSSEAASVPLDRSTEAENEKRAALRRTKAIATGALVACFSIFLAARAFQDSYPYLAYVAAFAEAATIGGLADWYAVVALFKRPLGLPIPHTAIIPSNKDRIADNLGRFIEVNFLSPAAVREKLEDVDFAALVADWLSDRDRSKGLSNFVAGIAPRALDAMEGSGLKDFVAARVREQMERVKVAPLAADLLGSMTADRRHQQLFDELLRVLGGILRDEETLAAIQAKIRDELPTLARMFKADAYLLRKIVASAGTFLQEVEEDADHALRAEFDRFVEGFIERLRTSPDYRERAEKLKRELLARPEIQNLAGNFLTSLRHFAERDLQSGRSRIRAHLTDMFVEVGRQLAVDETIRRDMNEGFVVALSSFVENQKSGVAKFISDQVRRWDMGQLTRLVELNIGRDLQYIRFNGMLIGGIAGLALHVTEQLLID